MPASGTGDGEAADPAAPEPPGAATGAEQTVPEDGVVEAVSDEDGVAPPAASRRPSQRSRASAPEGTAPGEASPGPERQRSQSFSRRSRHRRDQSSPQPRPEAATEAQSPPPGLAPPSEAGGWARPDGAAPFIRVDTAATGVRPLAPPPMPASGRSPPRLLRVPQPPAAYQQTRWGALRGGGVNAAMACGHTCLAVGAQALDLMLLMTPCLCRGLPAACLSTGAT